jgi:hypothetical protein
MNLLSSANRIARRGHELKKLFKRLHMSFAAQLFDTCPALNVPAAKKALSSQLLTSLF